MGYYVKYHENIDNYGFKEKINKDNDFTWPLSFREKEQSCHLTIT